VTALEKGWVSDGWSRLPGYLKGSPTLSRSLEVGRGLFSGDVIGGLFNDSGIGRIAAGIDPEPFLPILHDEVEIRGNVSCYLLHRYLGQQLLRDSDNFSMAFSLELRTPLVDSFLYRDVAKIPQEKWFFEKQVPKSLLVDAVGDLAPQQVERPKMGFTLPFQEWLMESKPVLESGFLNNESFASLYRNFQSGSVHWSRIWAIWILDRYLKGFSAG
jgi:asparagine synthase (glutamine-hydrolysing)